MVWTARGTVIGALQRSSGGEAPLCTHWPATITTSTATTAAAAATTAARRRPCHRCRHAPPPQAVVAADAKQTPGDA